MKFMLVASFPDSLLRFRGALITALQAKGIEVHVVAPELIKGSSLYQKMVDLGLNVHSVPLRRTGMNPLDDLRSLFNLFILIRKIKPKFFLAYTVKPVIYGSLASWLAGVPRRFSLITGLGYALQDSEKPSLLHTLVFWLYRLALITSHKVFFQNPDDQAFFRSKGMVSKTGLSVVVNGSGVDVNDYDIVPMPKIPHFLLIARLLGNKGVREYVEAARHLHPIHPEIKFWLVGWIDEGPDAISQEELDGWIIEGIIEYRGHMSDVRPAIAEASVYVLPSYREGTPRTILEAMAMGRAIITADSPGCRETVIHGLNGFLVPIKRVDLLVDAMCQFINIPLLASRMGMHSRALALEKYDVRKVNELMLREMGI